VKIIFKEALAVLIFGVILAKFVAGEARSGRERVSQEKESSKDLIEESENKPAQNHTLHCPARRCQNHL
jgi:hypothetical protein